MANPTEVPSGVNNGSRPTPQRTRSFARQKALADKIMDDDREVLRKLAE